MTEQIEKFDPSKLMDGVKDRIKATFVSLIPDAQWEQMCDIEMKKFFEPQLVKEQYGSNITQKPSQFEDLVMQLMKEHCTAYLKGVFAKPEYSVDSIWEYRDLSGKNIQKITVSEHLDKMIKERMPDMMQAMLGQVLKDAFYQFFQNIQNGIPR